jgi:hypothetical protein
MQSINGVTVGTKAKNSKFSEIELNIQNVVDSLTFLLQSLKKICQKKCQKKLEF